MKYSEVLTKAKELLRDPKNWNKDGDYYKDDNPDSGCYCIFGAINEVTYEEYLSTLESRFQGEVGVTSESVIHFNDDPKTTHQDLMDWFDKTIREVKVKESVDGQ